MKKLLLIAIACLLLSGVSKAQSPFYSDQPIITDITQGAGAAGPSVRNYSSSTTGQTCGYGGGTVVNFTSNVGGQTYLNQLAFGNFGQYPEATLKFGHKNGASAQEWFYIWHDGNLNNFTSNFKAKDIQANGRVFVNSLTGLYLGNDNNVSYAAQLKYNTNGNLDISPRSGYNTVFTSGNVGIGTIAPGAKLDVNGVIRTYNIDNSTATWDNLSMWSDGSKSFIQSNGDDGGGLFIKSNGANKVVFESNVSIGTNSPNDPQAKLHINNGDNSYGAILAQATEAEFQLYTKTLTTQVPAGQAWTNLESFRIGLKYNQNENNGFISFYRGGADLGGYLGFSTNGIERIRISTNGYVGIGTNAPDEMLTVKGNIHALAVLVDLNGPLADFVFAPSYNLKPLAEVEAFVKENKHLPEIPSAAEVAEKGVNLGEMQNKLLQKVEELTLYAIEQQKLLAGQQTLLANQQAQIEELKKIVSESRK